jgi:DNA-binding transcriptional regulator YiaG
MSPRKIKALRKKLGLSQEALARRLDCSTAAVRKWESAENGMRPDKKIKLAAIAQSDK